MQGGHTMNVLLRNGLNVVLLMTVTSLSWAADCTVSATSANFGDYNTMGNAHNRSGIVTIVVFCSSTVLLQGNETVNYTLMINGGLSGNPGQRGMSNTGHMLSYNLYSDAALTQVWGDGAGGTFVVTGTMMLTPGRPTASAAHTAYGIIPYGQNVASGQFSDLLSVTLIY